ncbi:hypothetical protein [Rhizobium herbae]
MKDGYAPFLKSMMPEVEIKNFSLGGAPSIYGCYVLDRENIVEDFDYAIIDFCINDQQMERNLFLTLENIVSAFGSMLSQFKPGGRCKPLVILFPQREAFTDPRLMKVRDAAKRLCQQFNIATIDAFDLVATAHSQYGADTASFFSDWAHMRKDHAQAFGRLVVDALTSLPELKFSEVTALLPNYSVAHPCTLPKVERGTSLMCEDTFVLKGDELAMRIDGYLAGFLHWCNDDTGPLLLDAGGQKLCLPCRKEKRTLDNRFAFTNPATAIKCGGPVQMRVGIDHAYKIMRVFGNRPDFPKDGTEIGISGLVVADKDPMQAGTKAINFLERYEMQSKKQTESEFAFIKSFAGIEAHV